MDTKTRPTGTRTTARCSPTTCAPAPPWSQWERAGIEVMEVRAGSIAARHGAQSGDVIISINGYPVNSQQEAIQWAKDNGDNYEVFTVVVERLGRLETLTYRKPAQQ
ncbi:MAG: PDZ domain-containing protein [Planctomycetota bacterium]